MAPVLLQVLSVLAPLVVILEVLLSWLCCHPSPHFVIAAPKGVPALSLSNLMYVKPMGLKPQSGYNSFSLPPGWQLLLYSEMVHHRQTLYSVIQSCLTLPRPQPASLLKPTCFDLPHLNIFGIDQPLWHCFDQHYLCRGPYCPHWPMWPSIWTLLDVHHCCSLISRRKKSLIYIAINPTSNPSWVATFTMGVNPMVAAISSFQDVLWNNRCIYPSPQFNQHINSLWGDNKRNKISVPSVV